MYHDDDDVIACTLLFLLHQNSSTCTACCEARAQKLTLGYQHGMAPKSADNSQQISSKWFRLNPQQHV
jgi:hypothetical protein